MNEAGSKPKSTTVDVGTSACLLVNIFAAVWLMNTTLISDPLAALPLQLIKVALASVVFCLLATSPLRYIHAGKRFYTFWTQDIRLFAVDRQRAIGCTVAGLALTLAIFAYNSFQAVWPSPIPISASLFMMIAVVSDRLREIQGGKPIGSRLYEAGGALAIYVCATGIYSHLFNTTSDVILAMVAFVYLTYPRAVDHSA